MTYTARNPLYPPSRDAIAAGWRRSFIRASTVRALVEVRQRSEIDVLNEMEDDPSARLMTRGAVEPLKASDFPGSTLTGFKALAPRAASIAVLEMGVEVDLTGVDQYAFPLAESFTSAEFVAEGAPIKTGRGVFASMLLGPIKKIAMIAGLSDELQSASAGKASNIIAHTIEVMIGRGLDAKLFSADAPTDIAPGGLLWNVAPIAAGASMADDLSGLVAKIAESGVSTESIIFVAAPSQATKIKLVAGPLFNHRVIGANIAADSVIAIATSGLAVAGSGEPEIRASKFATLHVDDQPAHIATPPAVIAAPTVSMLQTATYALRLVSRISWVCAPGGVAAVNSVTW
jgi:hypothetical protein